MLLTPFGVDLWNTLLYHLEALQLSFSPFFLCSFPTLSEGYNTYDLTLLTYNTRHFKRIPDLKLYPPAWHPFLSDIIIAY